MSSSPPSISGSKSVLYPDQITFSEKSSSSTTQKCLILLLVVLFAAAAVFLALFLVYFFKYEDTEKNEMCDTVDCVKAAAMVADQMDPTVDPCEDFAQFACGNFYRTAVYNEGETVKNSFSVVHDRNTEVLKAILTEDTKPGDPDYVNNMRKLYQSCMDEAQIEKVGVRPYLDSPYAKEWPTLIGQNWAGEATFNLNDAITRYMAIAVEPIFSYAVVTDIMNSSRRIVALIDPSLGLSREYFSRPKNDSVLQAYVTYLTDFAIELGAEAAVARQDAEDVLDLEIKLSNITVPREERRDLFKQYNPTTLAALGQEYPYIDIPRGIRAGFSLANISLDDQQYVNVYFPSYYEKLEDVLDKADKRALMNLFGSKTALSRVGSLTKRLREIALDWSKVYSGRTEETPRWKTCRAVASGSFSLGISKEFTRRTFSEDSKKYMDAMIDNLKVSFREILRDITWMSDKTKDEAFQKLDGVGRKIGYPDEKFDDEHFAVKYENLTMTADNYYLNLRTRSWTGLIKYLQKLEEPVDKKEWGMPPYAVNAYYSATENEVVFPAGILQPPFYSDLFPDSINYGAIGMVIGHEITHGFDDQGSQFDKNGVLRNWWQKVDQDKFKARRQCIVDQYGNFRDKATGKNLNGINTQGENVADNGGLKESYRAYKKLVEEKGEQRRLPGLGYTNDQLFFLGFAQLWCEKATKQTVIANLENGVHSLGRFRIIGTLQNSPEFAKAYNCPAGSPMNPEKKCSVW